MMILMMVTLSKKIFFFKLLNKFLFPVITLLDRVTRIVTLLHSLSNLNLDEKRARDFYQTYISDYKSNMKYNKENVESGKISLFIFYNLKQYKCYIYFLQIFL